MFVGCTVYTQSSWAQYSVCSMSFYTTVWNVYLQRAWLNNRIYSVWYDRKQIGKRARWDRQLVLPQKKRQVGIYTYIRNLHITVKFKQKTNLAKTGVSSSVYTALLFKWCIYCWWCKQTYSLKADGQTGPPHHREYSSPGRSGNTQALDTEATLEAVCLYSHQQPREPLELPRAHC